MTFRPLPVLTICALAALAMLTALGWWQLQRMAWKADLIAEWEVARAAGPISMEAAFCAEAAPAIGQAVAPIPETAGPQIRLLGRSIDGRPGWRLFEQVGAGPSCRCGAPLVEVGFEPQGQPGGIEPVAAVRLEPTPSGGLFTPDPNIAENRFYAFDRAAMAQALGEPPDALIETVWLAADDGSPPADLAQTPPARHLGYALTWFGMAIALIVIYAVFHASKGRLRFRGSGG